MKTREVVRLVWSTLTSWRRPPPPEPRPGDDTQFSTWPRIWVADLNLEHQHDEDERRYRP